MVTTDGHAGASPPIRVRDRADTGFHPSLGDSPHTP
jgi:hypothetical protein